jgi:hypothetical protein
VLEGREKERQHVAQRSEGVLRHNINELDHGPPPSTGQNLLVAGADLLDAPTGTVVVQRSEEGQGILGGEEGKGMWV